MTTAGKDKKKAHAATESKALHKNNQQAGEGRPYALTMKSAAGIWKIPLADVKRAKHGGSDAFTGNRIYRSGLLEWLAANPAGAGEGDSPDMDSEELKKQKLAAEIKVLGKRLERESHALSTLQGESIPKALVRESWARNFAIMTEEAKFLMSRDVYLTWVTRIKAKMKADDVTPGPGRGHDS